MRPARPLVGPALVVVGVAHTALTVRLHRDGVRALLRAGVVDALRPGSPDPVRAALAFWFATAGLGMVGAGAVVTELERGPEPLPPALPWVLAGVGGWGAVVLPRSPFWVLVALGGAAEAGRRRRSR